MQYRLGRLGEEVKNLQVTVDTISDKPLELKAWVAKATVEVNLMDEDAMDTFNYLDECHRDLIEVNIMGKWGIHNVQGAAVITSMSAGSSDPRIKTVKLALHGRRELYIVEEGRIENTIGGQMKAKCEKCGEYYRISSEELSPRLEAFAGKSYCDNCMPKPKGDPDLQAEINQAWEAEKKAKVIKTVIKLKSEIEALGARIKLKEDMIEQILATDLDIAAAMLFEEDID